MRSSLRPQALNRLATLACLLAAWPLFCGAGRIGADWFLPSFKWPHLPNVALVLLELRMAAAGETTTKT